MPRLPVFLISIMLALPAHALQLDTMAREALLFDITTHTTLLEKNADTPMPPSSMSKLMTTYMVLDRIKQGSLSMDDTLPVSEKAWRMGGSKMFVRVGESVSVKDLLLGVSVQSGNDACIVLAEGLSGSEEAFAAEMTRKGKEIGLTGSNFMNATGWPDPNHYMTARDLATLTTRLLEDFPEHAGLFGIPEFTYNNIRQSNRNPLLHKGLGVDGMKTGHTDAAGYGVTISGEQDGRRIVLVINGLSSMKERAAEAERLYLHAFRAFEAKKFFSKTKPSVSLPVWMGEAKTITAQPKEATSITVPRASNAEISIYAEAKNPIHAPIKQGDEVGVIIVEAPELSIRKTVPLVATHDVAEITGIKRWLLTAKNHLLAGDDALPAR